MAFIAVYITHENMDEARKVASHLLDKKLVACANFFPIESAYWWQGSIETANEIVSIVKTRAENWERVKSEVEKIHPYDVPCIIRFDVEANDAFESWILDSTTGCSTA